MRFGLFCSPKADRPGFGPETGQGFFEFIDFNVEAESLGFGASTRNGGIVHPGYKWGPKSLIRRYGEDTGRDPDRARDYLRRLKDLAVDTGVPITWGMFSMRAAPQVEGFIPFRQMATTRVSVVVDAPRAEPALAREMRDAVTAIDPHLPLYRLQTLDEIYSASLGRDRFLLTLVAVFAALALLLASMGVYGVTAEATAQRTQEIGIRVALGARPGEIAELVLRQGLVLAAFGILAGLAVAAAATRALTGVLFGVEPLDLTTFAAVAVVLGLAALVASAMPARRAARLDPLVALRRD